MLGENCASFEQKCKHPWSEISILRGMDDFECQSTLDCVAAKNVFLQNWVYSWLTTLYS